MSYTVVLAIAIYTGLHIAAALIGIAYAWLISRLPWITARYLVGWMLGTVLFLMLVGVAWAVNDMRPSPGYALAFAFGALWCSWALRPKVTVPRPRAAPDTGRP